MKLALLIIGEAAMKSWETWALNWRRRFHGGKSRAWGNHLRHESDRIDVVRIWFVVDKELAPLKAAVERALKSTGRRRGVSRLRKGPSTRRRYARRKFA